MCNTDERLQKVLHRWGDKHNSGIRAGVIEAPVLAQEGLGVRNRIETCVGGIDMHLHDAVVASQGSAPNDRQVPADQMRRNIATGALESRSRLCGGRSSRAQGIPPWSSLRPPPFGATRGWRAGIFRWFNSFSVQNSPGAATSRSEGEGGSGLLKRLQEIACIRRRAPAARGA
jgi:hypothetical protein